MHQVCRQIVLPGRCWVPAGIPPEDELPQDLVFLSISQGDYNSRREFKIELIIYRNNT
jgi:hypothetical protein